MNEFTCSCGKHYRFDMQAHVLQFNVHLDNVQFHFVVTPTAAAPGETGEEHAEQLVSEMLSVGPDQEHAEMDTGEDAVATIPAVKTSKPAAAKAAPDSKTRPAPAKADEDLEAFKISPAYLVTLGVLAILGFGYLAWGYFGGPVTPAALEARALAAPIRKIARPPPTNWSCATARNSRPSCAASLRRARIPEVLAIALVGLTNGVENEATCSFT